MSGDPQITPRVPPHSMEAEQAVLGAVMIDNDQYDAVAALLRPDDFHHPMHRGIWSTVCRLIAARQLADAVTVSEGDAHDAAYCNGLCVNVLNPRHALHYAGIVKDRSVRRQAMAVGAELADAALRTPSKSDNTAELIESTIARLLQLQATGSATQDPQSIADLLPPFIDALELRASGHNDAIATGLHDVDRLLSGGFRPGELIVIGARPSMGKSALSGTIARNVAASVPVLVLSMEDSRHMLVARQVASAGRVNLADIRSPERAPDSLWTGVADGADILKPLMLHIDDSPALSLRDVRRKAAQVRHRAGRLGLVVVDYLQLMQGDGDNRHQVLGAIAAGLKAMAKELGVAVILLSQLNREADKSDSPPRLDHLRESGGIEEAADIVGLLWREHRRKPRPDNKHDAQIEFAKHKNGPTDTVRLWFDGATQRFEDSQGGADHGHH